jgi:hypothetical protein
MASLEQPVLGRPDAVPSAQFDTFPIECVPGPRCIVTTVTATGAPS